MNATKSGKGTVAAAEDGEEEEEEEEAVVGSHTTFHSCDNSTVDAPGTMRRRTLLRPTTSMLPSASYAPFPPSNNLENEGTWEMGHGRREEGVEGWKGGRVGEEKGGANGGAKEEEGGIGTSYMLFMTHTNNGKTSWYTTTPPRHHHHTPNTCSVHTCVLCGIFLPVNICCPETPSQTSQHGRRNPIKPTTVEHTCSNALLTPAPVAAPVAAPAPAHSPVPSPVTALRPLVPT
jgi:hypothetical protein